MHSRAASAEAEEQTPPENLVIASAQATRLRRIGCDTGQGWLYSRPVPADRISELLGTPGVQAGVGNP